MAGSTSASVGRSPAASFRYPRDRPGIDAFTDLDVRVIPRAQDDAAVKSTARGRTAAAA
jgi:hypothetical protein